MCAGFTHATIPMCRGLNDYAARPVLLSMGRTLMLLQLLQERPKRARRNGLQASAFSALGSGGDDGSARDACDRLLADEPADEAVAAAQPDGQQATALTSAADVQSDDTQATQPLPHSPGGAADADELAGAGMAAGHSSGHYCLTADWMFLVRLYYDGYGPSRPCCDLGCRRS
jgi:hypothetical protein